MNMVFPQFKHILLKKKITLHSAVMWQYVHQLHQDTDFYDASTINILQEKVEIDQQWIVIKFDAFFISTFFDITHWSDHVEKNEMPPAHV